MRLTASAATPLPTSAPLSEKPATPFPDRKATWKITSNRNSLKKLRQEYVDFVLHSRPFLPTIVDVPNYIHRTKVTDVATHIPRADAKWIGQRLAQLSDQQIRDCFQSAGYSPEQVEGIPRPSRKESPS